MANAYRNHYSMVKGFTDRLVQLLPHCVLNVRLRMPITHANHKRDFLSKILAYRHTLARGQAESFSVLPSLLPCLFDMMANGNTGTINLCNPGTITLEEIVLMYKSLAEPTIEYRPADTDSQSIKSHLVLDTSKLCRLYPQIPVVHEALRRVILDRRALTTR